MIAVELRLPIPITTKQCAVLIELIPQKRCATLTGFQVTLLAQHLITLGQRLNGERIPGCEDFIIPVRTRPLRARRKQFCVGAFKQRVGFYFPTKLRLKMQDKILSFEIWRAFCPVNISDKF